MKCRRCEEKGRKPGDGSSQRIELAVLPDYRIAKQLPRGNKIDWTD